MTLNGTLRGAPGPPCAVSGASGGGGVVVNNASVVGWRARPVRGASWSPPSWWSRRRRVMERPPVPGCASTRCHQVLAITGRYLVKMTTPSSWTTDGPRGLRQPRAALGGGQRDGVPGVRLLLVHDRRSRLRQQPTCVGRRRPAPLGPRCGPCLPRRSPGDHHPERRRELLDTAAEVFAERATTPPAIARDRGGAGMLAGSLYH